MKREMSDEDRYHYEDMARDSAMTEAEKKQVRIDDMEDSLRDHFSVEYLIEAIREADQSDLQELNQALKDGEALEVWGLLKDIKDCWIREFARFQVEDRE